MKRATPRAFSLVEVALALGVLAFALVAIFSLLPSGLQASRNAEANYVATEAASLVMDHLHSLPREKTTTDIGLTIPRPGDPPVTQTIYYTDEATSGDSFTPNLRDSSRYRIDARLVAPPAGQHSATSVQLQITSPPQADPKQAQARLEFYGALDRNLP